MQLKRHMVFTVVAKMCDSPSLKALSEVEAIPKPERPASCPYSGATLEEEDPELDAKFQARISDRKADGEDGVRSVRHDLTCRGPRPRSQVAKNRNGRLVPPSPPSRVSVRASFSRSRPLRTGWWRAGAREPRMTWSWLCQHAVPTQSSCYWCGEGGCFRGTSKPGILRSLETLCICSDAWTAGAGRSRSRSRRNGDRAGGRAGRDSLFLSDFSPTGRCQNFQKY